MATRRERVVMDLESNLPEGMLRSAAAVAVLRQELKRLNGDYDRLSVSSVKTMRATQDGTREVDKMSKSAQKADQSINQLTGRLRLFADIAAILGPALAPLGAVGLAGLMAFTAQLGSAAIAGGVLIGSLQGVGDALGAMYEADLEPTTDNLAELDAVMARLSPAAREFAREAFGLLPALRALRDTGAASLFPGLVDSIDNLELLQSELERIMRTNGRVVGNMAADITASLASERWEDFFAFVATDGPQAIRQLTATVGSLTHGLAELWMAFDPVNDDAGRWMKNIAADFDAWASGLDQTEGFQNFMEYLRTTGPQVSDMLGSLFNALVQITQAAAPLGGPVLEGMTALLDTLAAIAGSDVGPTLMAAVTAMSLLSRATSLYDKAAASSFNRTHIANIRGMAAALDVTARNQQRASMSVADFAAAEEKRSGAIRAGLGSLGKSAALMGGLALASTGAADSIGLTNTISLGLMGTMAGPWGAAIGGAIGLALDLGKSQDDTAQRVADLTSTFDAQTGAITANTRAKINQQAQDAGLLTAAEKLGLAASTVTDAIMGNADAQKILNEAVANYGVDYSITSTEDLAKNYSEAEIRTIMLTRAATLLRDEVPGMTSTFSSAAKEAAQFGRGMESAGEETSKAESKIESFNRAVARLNRLLSDRASMRDYQQAIDDFAESIKENGRNWDITTQKGRDNQAALDDIVGTTLKVAEGLRGANRQKFLTNAIADLRTMADNAKVPQGQVRDLIRLLREANGTNVKPKVIVDTKEAMSKLYEVQRFKIGDKIVRIHAVRTGADADFMSGGTPQAGGGFVPKTGLPYADRHHYLLADGEGITTNRRGETDRFRDVIHGINAGLSRRAIKGMLADGGVVGESAKPTKKKRPPVGNLDSLLEFGFTGQQLQAQLAAAQLQAEAAADQEWAARAAERAAQDQLDAAQQAYDAAEANLRAAEQMAESFRDSVKGQFNNSLTGGGLAGLMQTLSRDTNAGSSMDQILQALVAAGLDVTGPASGLYRELAASDDLQTANELLGAPELISMLEQQYAARDAANAQRAENATRNTFGPLLAQEQAQFALAQAMLADSQTGHAVAQAQRDRMSSQLTTLEDAVSNLAGQFADKLNSTVRGGRK